MGWWSRLIGGAPKRSTTKSSTNDPEARLAKFKRAYHDLLSLCNRPRNLATEAPLLEQLRGLLDRLNALLKEETRAPAPHVCLQFAAANQVYTVISRAAIVSQDEPIIQSTISVLAALVDSEEEDFLSSAPFAKSLMRLVTKVSNGEGTLVGSETETAILELLFTIAAKIRLQPEILPYWFRSTAKPELEDVFVKEKKSFVGIAHKDDFPLCYLLIDRVHHEGRIGDFARTGLLYVFEATGRSLDLEDWTIESDLPTLLASGLGALYSQLSRELSILHPDSTLPAVLAMSDYSTTHPRATSESAFSDRHQSHMSTFLSYLAFWQDILDHCKSVDVKQTLLDHFQILFLQQVLYPSILQSSDRDAGSSVAVLTYMTAMLESLHYPDLMQMMLAYLLAVPEGSLLNSDAPSSLPQTPRSPTTSRRRQSLILLTTPKDPDDIVEPVLFSLVDLILNNISSENSQSCFAALKLSSTMLSRQKKSTYGTLLRVQNARRTVTRTRGALDLELEKLMIIATSFHDHSGLNETYAGLVDDVRSAIEAQVSLLPPAFNQADKCRDDHAGQYLLSTDDHFLKTLTALLRTFLTNSIDVNLALTEVMISIAISIEVRLDGWLAFESSKYSFEDTHKAELRPWQAFMGDEEKATFTVLQQASRRPKWSDNQAPMLFKTLQALANELDTIRSTEPNLDNLILNRKNMLQATNIDGPALLPSSAPSLVSSPTQASFSDAREQSESEKSQDDSRSTSRNNATDEATSPQDRSLASSPAPTPADESSNSSQRPKTSIFLPPPPDAPSTTDVLMQVVTLPAVGNGGNDEAQGKSERAASLNHILTNVVVLQEFVLELVAVLQVRAAVLGEKEIKMV